MTTVNRVTPMNRFRSVWFRTGGAGLAGCLLLLAHPDPARAENPPAVADTVPAAVRQLASHLAGGGLTPESRMEAARALLKLISTYPRLDGTAWKQIFPVAKQFVLSADPLRVPIGAVLLDAWSEGSIVHRDAIHSFGEYTGLWADALGMCVERQALPAAAGGDRYRRILFRHAWDVDQLSVLPVPDRRKWIKHMISLVHAGTPVVEPFLLTAIWSMPVGDRETAVRELSARMGQDSARLLVALTLHTLVPQDTIDAARNHLAVHGIRKTLMRDLKALINELREGDTEESMWLKDAIRIGLRSEDPHTLAAALHRLTNLMGRPVFTPDLKTEALSVTNGIFRKKNLLLFDMSYRLLNALYSQQMIPFDALRAYYGVAVENNPFDTAVEGPRKIILRNSEGSWLEFMGQFLANPAFPKSDRRDVLRRLMSIEPSEWYEEHLQTVIESTAVNSGLLSRADYDSWAKKRLIRE